MSLETITHLDCNERKLEDFITSLKTEFTDLAQPVMKGSCKNDRRHDGTMG